MSESDWDYYAFTIFMHCVVNDRDAHFARAGEISADGCKCAGNSGQKWHKQGKNKHGFCLFVCVLHVWISGLLSNSILLCEKKEACRKKQHYSQHYSTTINKMNRQGETVKNGRVEKCIQLALYAVQWDFVDKNKNEEQQQQQHNGDHDDHDDID